MGGNLLMLLLAGKSRHKGDCCHFEPFDMGPWYIRSTWPAPREHSQWMKYNCNF